MLLTSRTWSTAPLRNISPKPARRLRLLSTLLAGLVLVQVVLGVLIRHTHGPWARGHLLMAFAVVALVTVLALAVYASPATDRLFRRALMLLKTLLVLQLVLGVEAWMTRWDRTGPAQFRRPQSIKQ